MGVAKIKALGTHIMEEHLLYINVLEMTTYNKFAQQTSENYRVFRVDGLCR